MTPRDAMNGWLHEVSDRPFAWGAHDCFTFTNGAWHAMFGYGWADRWMGRYLINGRPLGPRRFAALLDALEGTTDLLAALDKGLSRVTGFPPYGALLLTASARPGVIRGAFGIAVGRRGVFVADKGVIYLPYDQIVGAWTR